MDLGIYAIRNLVNGKRYVGSTGKLSKRWGQHKFDLNKGTHFNGYLQRSWNKYGESSFVYEIVEICYSKDNLLDREEHWIKELRSHKTQHGYNFSEKPRATRLGCKASPETIAKMKISLGGENHPMWGKHLKIETKNKLRDIQRGVSKPTSGRRKQYIVISPTGEEIKVYGLRDFCKTHGLHHTSFWRIATGKQKEYNGWLSTTYILKPIVDRVGYWKGKTLSEETRRKMSISGKGKNKGPISEKRRLAIIKGIKEKKNLYD